MPTQFLFSARTRQPRLEGLADFTLRISVGVMMALSHGLGKVPPSGQFIEGVQSMGFPVPWLFAWLAAGAEFLGGFFVAIGLFTRPAAAAIGFTMFIAAFVRHAADPFIKKEMALLYFAFSMYFLLVGAGRYSIDALIAKRRG